MIGRTNAAGGGGGSVEDLKKYMAEVKIPDEFTNTNSLKSFMSSDKKLWLLGCGVNHNIYKFNEETNSFDLFFNDDSFTNSLTGIWEYSDNIIFFTFSYSTILVKYDRQTNEFVNITIQSLGSSTPTINSMLFMDYGLFIRLNNHVQFIDFETNTSVDSGYMYNPNVVALNNDTSTDIIVTSDNYAIIWRFDKNTKQWVKDWQGSSGYISNILTITSYDTLGHSTSEKATINNWVLIQQRVSSSNVYWLYRYSDTPTMTELENFPGGSIYKTNDPSKYIICESNKQPKIYLWDVEVNTINQIGQYTTEQTGTVYPHGFEYNGKYIIYVKGVSNMTIIDKETLVQIDVPNPSTIATATTPQPIVAHNGDLLFIYSTTIMFRLNFTTNTLEFIYGSETTTSKGYSGLYLRFVYNNKTYIAPDNIVEYSNQASGLYEYDGNAITQISEGGGHDLVIYENRAFAISKFAHAGLVTIGAYTVCLDDTTKKWTKTLINCNNKYYLASARQYDVCEELNIEDFTTQVSNDTGITACLLSKHPIICLNAFTTSSTGSGGKVIFSNQNTQAVSTRIYKSPEYLFTQKIPVFVNNTGYGAFYLWFKGEFA